MGGARNPGPCPVQGAAMQSISMLAALSEQLCLRDLEGGSPCL